MRQFHHKYILVHRYLNHPTLYSIESIHLPFIDMLTLGRSGLPSIHAYRNRISSKLVTLWNIHSMTSFKPSPHDFTSVAWALSWEEMVSVAGSLRLRNLHLQSINHRYYSLSAMLTRLPSVVKHSHCYSRWKCQHLTVLGAFGSDSVN